MFTELQLDGFKRFAFGSPSIPLAPITLILGANGSGKSTILQAFRMMRQTWTSFDELVTLRTNGPQVELGVFGNVVHRHEAERGVGIQLRHYDRGVGLRWLTSATPDESLPVRGGLQELEIALRSVTAQVVVEEWDNYGEVQLGVYPTKSSAQELELERAGWNREDDDAPLRLTWDPLSANFHRSDRYFSPDRSEGRFVLDELFEAVQVVVDAMRKHLARVISIGPLRRPGRRIEPLDGQNDLEVGFDGGRMAEVLLQGDTFGALSQLLPRFGFELAYREIQMNSRHLALQVRHGDLPWVGIQDTGFGISQILPILVQVARLRDARGEGTYTLLLEQPELHLHPRWQAELLRVLAEPFKEGSIPRHQIIAETHSELMVLAAQRMVRTGQLPPETFALLFVEKDPFGGSRARHIRMGKDGEFADEWPEGFFPDRYDEVFDE